MMQQLDDKQNIDKQIKPKSFSVLPLFIILIVLAIALFVGDLLFGKNSFSVYENLQNDKQVLNKKITKLKNENSKLHIQYFELKGLLPPQEDDL
jgi:cell division protein FtsB